MKNKVVTLPSIKLPIQPSPGFAKKLLADEHLDIMQLCGAGCLYCSTNVTTPMRVNRERWADETEKQLGERLYPNTAPALTFAWPDVIDRLAAQLHGKPTTWGAGRTLVFSQLTDAFSPIAVGNGTTEAALRLVLDKTSFRIRALTKFAIVGASKWIELFQRHPGRFTVGLSTGTLDHDWAHAVEIGTSSPSARVTATRALQDAGISTFGMLCPIFPDMLRGDGVERLVEAIRPARCEDVWAEAYNDRDNWKAVRDGYAEGSAGRAWMDRAYGARTPGAWSAYATELYQRLHAVAARDGWTAKLKYLLYEGDVAAEDARTFAGFSGVLLQGTCQELPVAGPVVEGGKAPKPLLTGWSSNAAVRALQRWEGHGFVKPGFPAPAVAA